MLQFKALQFLPGKSYLPVTSSIRALYFLVGKSNLPATSSEVALQYFEKNGLASEVALQYLKTKKGVEFFSPTLELGTSGLDAALELDGYGLI